MNKDLIKKRFARKLNFYDDNAKIQKKMAEKLISMLGSLNDGINILEIGCGTGLLTKYVNKTVKFKNYTALDIVSECEKYIKEINPVVEFISDDIEEYIKNSQTYDLIISNASLQWVENLPEFTDKLVKRLNSNGILLFSTFGKENFREIYFTSGKTLSYLSKKELAAVLKNHKPQIEEEVYVMAFKTPKDVLKHIQNTGVNALSAESWTKADLAAFEKEYNIFCANRPTLTYNPIYIKIKK